MIRVDLNPEEISEAERLGRVSWDAVLARHHRSGGKRELRTQILARYGEMAVARYLGVQHPCWGLDHWPLERSGGADIGKWGVRCCSKRWYRLNIRRGDDCPMILVLGHEPPCMWIVGWIDSARGREIGQTMINGDADDGDALWWAVRQDQLTRFPGTPGTPGTGPGPHVSAVIAADPRFWCENCNGMHPLSQHRACRESA